MNEYHRDTLGTLEEQLHINTTETTALREALASAYGMFESQTINYSVSVPDLLEWMSPVAQVRVGRVIESHPDGQQILHPRLQLQSRLKQVDNEARRPFVMTYKLDFTPDGTLRRAYGKIDFGYFEDYLTERKLDKSKPTNSYFSLTDSEKKQWALFETEERQLLRSHTTFPLLHADVQAMKHILHEVYF